jgi:hypothetical protein
MGSCLTNLAALFLMSDYKWERPNNAAVLRSDHFVDKFIDLNGYLPSQDEFTAQVKWKAGFEKEGPRWLNECYRDMVGHLEVPLDKPGLFETLDTRSIDLVLMDNLHDSHSVLMHKRPKGGEPVYSLPFSLSRCENEQELLDDFYYGSPQAAEDSVKNWVRIIRFVQSRQPRAKIMFYCAHACTSVDLPDRYERALRFHELLAPLAPELGITVIPPLELPPEVTRMPEDRDHFDMQIYRAMAGHIVLCHMANLRGVAEPDLPEVHASKLTPA